jgi:tetratricopeptide (TPR) repeat protein
VDAELIVMCAALWKELGLEGIRLELNTIGSPQERAAYRADLVRHLQAHEASLDADAKRRLHTNPLRVLDSKNPLVQEVVTSAPNLLDYLGAESRAHFEGLGRLLAAAGVPYELNPRLVRGLDYYNLTVFEWVSDRLGAQGTVCGGGRYDGLFAQLGGKPAPGVGFAAGVERLVALLRESGRAGARRAPDAYLVSQGAGTMEYAFALGEELRAAGFAVVLHAGGGSFKSQMKKADASGAALALIVGEDELAAGTVSVKPLREAREQQAVPYAASSRRGCDNSSREPEHGFARTRSGRAGEARRAEGVVEAARTPRGRGDRGRGARLRGHDRLALVRARPGAARRPALRRAYQGRAVRRRQGAARGGRRARRGLRRTLYASMGALAAAQFYFERGELKSAKAQLQWVLERSPSAEFKALARLRLAALLLDEKAYDEALALLSEAPLEPYAAQFAALRGDVLLAKNQPAEARAAYQQALEKADGAGAAFRDSVQMRLDALGG